MGNPATGRSAARGAFQDRLCDSRGRELAFETLEQIVEAVRLAYQAGGQADPPEGSPLDEDPPPLEPEPLQGTTAGVVEELESEIEEDWARMRGLVADPPMNDPGRVELREATARVVNTASKHLVPKFIGGTLERMLHGVGRLNEWSPQRGASVATLVRATLDLGYSVSMSPDELKVGVFSWGPGELSPEAAQGLHMEDFWFWPDSPFYRVSSQLPWAELPPPTLPSGWVRELDIEHLGTVDQAGVALTTDRLLYERITMPRAVIPLVSLALLRSVSTHAWRATPGWRRAEALQLAASWIADSLPSGCLVGHPIEAEISRLQRAALQVRAEGVRAAHDLGGQTGRLEVEADYRKGQRQKIATIMRGFRRD